jgi:hypothetical protein
VTSGGRVIYEVNLDVDPGAAAEVAAWLQGHMAEVLACDGFVGAEWLDVDAGADAVVRWSLRYLVRDRPALDAYLAGPAAALRAEGVRRFGGLFTATRRVLRAREVIDTGAGTRLSDSAS